MGTRAERGDPGRRRRDRRAGVRLDAVHLHRVRADVLPVGRRALPVRADGRGGGVRDDRVVHPVAHAGADAGDAADGRRARAAPTASRACCSGSTAASTAQFERVRARLHAGAVGAARRGAGRSRWLFLGFCVLSCLLYPVLGRDFFPSVDAGQIRLHMRAPTGTRIEETARLADEVEAAIREHRPARPARDHPRQPRRAQQRHQPLVQQRRHDRHARRRDPAVAARRPSPDRRVRHAAARRAAEALPRHRVLLPAGRHRHADPQLRPARGDRRAVHRRQPRAATRRSPPSC